MACPAAHVHMSPLNQMFFSYTFERGIFMKYCYRLSSVLGALLLAGVTLSGGTVWGTQGRTTRGGGLRAAADVVLDRATIRDNRITGLHGEVAFDGSGATPAGTAQGGGLYVGGSLVATGATLRANSAQGGEGVDAATTGGPAASS